MTDARLRGRRVVVTGGAGFIGSHLVEALADSGATAFVLDNLQAGSWSNLDRAPSAVKVRGDVRVQADVVELFREARPELVFHLAANASVPGSVDDPRYDFHSNCGGTLEVLEAARRLQPGARIVLASSAAVYGQPTSFPMLESSAILPISPYGASKAAAEIQARMFHDVYRVQVVVARIFNTYGPRMARFVVLDFLRKLQRDDRILEILGSGGQVRDFTYVSDTVAGLLCLGEHGVPGDAYNVATGRSHSVTQLAQLLLQALSLEGKTRLHFTNSSWVGDAQRWEVDVAKLRALGYAPRVSLEEGLRRVVRWFGGTASARALQHRAP